MDEHLSSPHRIPRHPVPHSMQGQAISPQSNEMPVPSLTESDNQQSAPSSDPEGPNVPDTEPVIQLAVSHGWRPEYLRRRVLIIFNACFITIMIAVEVLYILSWKRKGLVWVENLSLSYLWTFGPTAVLTLLLIFWMRFEYQACRYTPWTILGQSLLNSKESTRDRTSQAMWLDYPNTWLPKAFIIAIRNRDWHVCIAMATTLLLRIQIILAAGLLYPGQASRPEQVSVLVKDEFREEDELAFSFNTEMATFMMQGIVAFNMSYPAGSSPGFAFQTVDGPADLTSSETLRSTLRGFTSPLDCEHVHSSFEWIGGTSRGSFNVSSDTFGSISWNITQFNGPGYYWISRYVGAPASRGTVSNDSVAGVAILHFAEDEVEEEGALQLVDSSAVMCQAVPIFGDFSVTQTGLDDNKPAAVVLIENGNQRSPPFDATGLLPWVWALGMYRWIDFPMTITSEDYASDPAMDEQFMLGLLSWTTGGGASDGRPPISELMHPAGLERMMRLSLERTIPFMAHNLLRTPVSRQALGQVDRQAPRLFVRGPTAHIMTALFALTTAITLSLLPKMAPRKGVVPRSATSLLDSMVLLCKSTKLLDSLRGTGHCQSESVQECMASSYQATLVHQPQHPLFPNYVVEPLTQGRRSSHSHISAPTAPCGDVLGDDRSKWYDPWPLKPWSRAAGLFFPAAIIVTLLVILDHSSKSGGLAQYPEQDSESRHYLWTSLPTSIFTLLSLFLGSFDSEIRSLSSFATLNRPSAAANFDALRVSYTDELGIRTILRALQHRDGVVAASKAVAIAAVFLTNFGASLFREEPVEYSVARKVQQETWVTTGECKDSSDNWYSPFLAGELVVNANLSFPPGTYMDMLLPDFTLLEETYDDTTEGDSRWSSIANANSPVRVTIPAVRPKLDCSLSTVANNQSGNQIGIELFGVSLICTSQCASGNRAFGKVILSSCYEANVDSMDSGDWMDRLPVSSLYTNYIWGACPENNDTESIPQAKLLSCHESFEEVDAYTTWLGSGLDSLDNASPPRPNDSSARPYETPGWSDAGIGISCGLNMYNKLGDLRSSVSMDFSLDGFFRTLSQSQLDFAIPEAYLAATAADKDEQVASAIRRLHGILRVQSVQNAAYSRLHYNQQSADLPYRRTRPGPVTAEVAYSGRRLVQDEATTYTVVGLLGLILALNVATIALSSERGGGGGRPRYRRVVPQSPGTIAALASLLADSNIFRYLPKHSQWLSEERIAQELRGQQFSMGWLDVNPCDPQPQDQEGSKGRKRFTIRLLESTEKPGRISRGDSESSG